MALRKSKESEDPADLVARKDFKKAIAIYKDRVSKQPKNATLRLSLADTLLMANLPDEAVREYKEVGALYTDDGFLVKAIAIYKKILKLVPGDRDVETFLEHLTERRGMNAPRPRAPEAPTRPPVKEKRPAEPPPAPPPPAQPQVQQIPPAKPPTPPPAPPIDLEPVEPPDIELPPMIELEPEEPIEVDLFMEPEPAPASVELETLLFRDLTPEEFRDFVSRFNLRHYEEDTIIVQEGDPGDSLFIIVRGQVRVITHDNRQNEIVLAQLGEGEFFGEVSLLTGKPRTATIITNLNSELLELTREDYDLMVAQYPHVKKVMEEFHQHRTYKTIESMIQAMRDHS